ncbi:hypothetical protein I6N96_03510 [Enterococcus sp. BWM-S5]|uniref:YkoY family integral membrane protein n=1 Tax=Enterococcus larvae TaxID=2794352 RepID=A0ABS4CFB4_9ENTE|nr:hypothetical protein [Enterococcus larvae]MBP1045331.1 hypothetical protein [Enterococcus larvae]
MKKNSLKWIVSGLVSVLLGLFFAYGSQIGFGNIIDSFTKPELDIQNAEPLYVDFDSKDGKLTSQTDDAYMVYHSVNSYVTKLALSVEAEEQPVDIKIYYSDGGDFSEEKSMQRTFSGKTLTFAIDSYVTDLRIDLGAAKGQTFEVKEVNLETPNILFSRGTLTLAFLLAIGFLFIFAHFILGPKKLYGLVDRHRYWVAAGLIALAVLFELSGSSLGSWGNYISMDNDGLLAGVFRPIRSDEWAVNTPFTMSQFYDGYSSVNSIIRGTLTDVSIVYGQPAFSLTLIFRLFSLGYVLLGTSYGLAFFWYGRLIVLFLVTYEFVKWLTNGNKPYAVLGSILITFAPIVQWWFAINGLVEMLIAMQLSLLFLDKYIKTDNSKKRAWYFVVILLCAGNFILTFYPSWMVPMAYIILAFAVWIIIENWSILKFKKIDVLNIVWMTVIFAAAIGYIFYSSKDTIDAVMNTVYPGSRLVTGGGFELENLWGGFANLFFPFREYTDIHNASEQAFFFDLFPLGILLSLFYMFKSRKKDTLMIILIGLSVFFLIWMCLGYPEIIAKLTMLNRSQPRRSYLAFGLINIFLLLRVLALSKIKIKPIWGIAAAGIYAAVAVFINKKLYQVFLDSPVLLVIIFVVAFVSGFLVISMNNKSKIVAVVIGSVVLISGISVNPLQQSTDAVETMEIGKELKNIQKEDEGKWIVEGMGLPMNNFLLMFGLPTINSTNVYPNLDLWEKIDTEKKYEEAYNRYAHIVINAVSNDNPEKGVFEVLWPDLFSVNLTLDDLKLMDVKYIFTVNDVASIPEFEKEVEFLYISDDGFRVYKIIGD